MQQQSNKHILEIWNYYYVPFYLKTLIFTLETFLYLSIVRSIILACLLANGFAQRGRMKNTVPHDVLQAGDSYTFGGYGLSAIQAVENTGSTAFHMLGECCTHWIIIQRMRGQTTS